MDINFIPELETPALEVFRAERNDSVGEWMRKELGIPE